MPTPIPHTRAHTSRSHMPAHIHTTQEDGEGKSGKHSRREEKGLVAARVWRENRVVGRGRGGGEKSERNKAKRMLEVRVLVQGAPPLSHTHAHIHTSHRALLLTAHPLHRKMQRQRQRQRGRGKEAEAKRQRQRGNTHTHTPLPCQSTETSATDTEKQRLRGGQREEQAESGSGPESLADLRCIHRLGYLACTPQQLPRQPLIQRYLHLPPIQPSRSLLPSFPLLFPSPPSPPPTGAQWRKIQQQGVGVEGGEGVS